MMLKDKIHSAQSGDQGAMSGLVTQFAPLIRKYGAKLHTEDGVYDLCADFIDLIRNVDSTQIHNDRDPGIIRYLETALRRCFIKRLVRAKTQDVPSISLDDMDDWRRDRIPQLAAHDSYFETEFLQTDGLTKKEGSVLDLIYRYGYSSAQVARKIHTTRQNVNQIKKRAEKKIKEKYSDQGPT